MKKTTTYDLYTGFWNPAGQNFTFVLQSQYETRADAKRGARGLKSTPWRVVKTISEITDQYDPETED